MKLAVWQYLIFAFRTSTEQPFDRTPWTCSASVTFSRMQGSNLDISSEVVPRNRTSPERADIMPCVGRSCSRSRSLIDLHPRTGCIDLDAALDL